MSLAGKWNGLRAVAWALALGASAYGQSGGGNEQLDELTAELYGVLENTESCTPEDVDGVVARDPLRLGREISAIVRRRNASKPIQPYAGFEDPVLRNAVLYAVRYRPTDSSCRSGMHDLLTLEQEGKLPGELQSKAIAEALVEHDTLAEGSTLVEFLKSRLFNRDCRLMIAGGIDKRISGAEGIDREKAGVFLEWWRGIESDGQLKDAIVAILTKHGLEPASKDLAAVPPPNPLPDFLKAKDAPADLPPSVPPQAPVTGTTRRPESAGSVGAASPVREAGSFWLPFVISFIAVVALYAAIAMLRSKNRASS